MIWKYNALSHLILDHRFLEDNAKEVPASMWLDMHVSHREETKFRIPEAVTSRFRDSNDIPGSDYFTDGIVNEIRSLVADRDDQREATKRQRVREGSTSTTYSTTPAAKIARY